MTVLIAGPRERLRHPEKAWRPPGEVLRKPPWLRVRAPSLQGRYQETRALLKSQGLHTVCEEAGCPNISECWNAGHATFMIMGDICTRGCAFCNVATGIPRPLDADEPERVAEAISRLSLRHAVITSVDRDDLEDGGARHFARTVEAVRRLTPQTTIEVLTPDFLRKGTSYEAVLASGPDVFNHNLETVPSLYVTIRPGARYYQSLRLLDLAKVNRPDLFTKSGLMLGLGEKREEVLQVLDDLRVANVDFLTLGQYLQPTRRHAPVKRFVPPEEFDDYAALAKAKGFVMVSASPLTRSSYHADEDFAKLKAARAEKLSRFGGRA